MPSGLPVVLWEIVWERAADGGTQAVLRFIAPGIADAPDPEIALADLDWLCTTHGIPLAALPAAPEATIVVTLMDRPVPRGQTDTEATQYFGVYNIENENCVSEDF